MTEPVPVVAESASMPGDVPALVARSRMRRWSDWLTLIARPALMIYWPLLVYLTHSPPSPSVEAVFHEIAVVQPDKWAHVMAFTVLTVLAVFAKLAGRRKSFITNLTTACVLCGIYGIADELTQGPFGRTVDGADVTADFGAVCGVYVLLLLFHPERRTLPWHVVVARVLFAFVVPLSGVLLFNEKLGANVQVWKIVPHWMGYIRGDYVAHFLASCGATLLLHATAPLGASRSRRRVNAMLVLGIMLALGPAIEWVQGHFTKRGDEWADVQAHTWGVFFAVVIVAVWEMILMLLRRMGVIRSVVEIEARETRQQAEAQQALELSHVAGAIASEQSHEPHAESGAGAGVAAPAAQGLGIVANAVMKDDLAGKTVADNEAASHRFVGHAILVGIMTLISRFTGLIRDAVLAAVLGLSATADAFSIGFLIPNLFRRLFGEGALTAAFIPIYTDLIAKDRLTARRLASLCIAVMLVFLGGLTLVGELVLMAMLHAREWTSDTTLAIELTMIMLPYMPMICIVAMVGGILQVHGKFGAPAAAPIFLNLVMIAGTFAAVNIAGGIDTDAKVSHAVVLVSWTVLIAGLVQLIWQLTMVLRVEKFTTVFAGAGPALKKMLVMMVPMFVGLGVFQINTLFDYLIAFMLSAKTGGAEQLHILGMTLDYPMDTGDVAALTWAQRLYQFPLGVFGIAVATAIFPALSRAAAGMRQSSETTNGETVAPALVSTEFQSILHHGLRLTFFIGLPASIGLILLRIPITRLIYERGEFGIAETQRVAFVMIGYASVVWAYSMTHVLTRAFYAVKDSKTPLKISIAMVLLNFTLNMILIWTPLGVAGLAWASAVSAVLQVVLLMRGLKRYVPEPVSGEVIKSWKMTAMLCLLMTVVLLPLTLIHDETTIGRVHSAVQLAVMLPVGAGIVLGGAWLMKADELKWLRRRSVK